MPFNFLRPVHTCSNSNKCWLDDYYPGGSHDNDLISRDDHLLFIDGSFDYFRRSKQHRDAVLYHLVSQLEELESQTSGINRKHIVWCFTPAPQQKKTQSTHENTLTPVDLIPLFNLPSGDSYSSTDFDINSTLPSAANPLGNPAFPGYTTSGAANWIGVLVMQYNKTLLLSYDFAYGGATTDASLVTPFEPTVLSFVDQVAEFSQSILASPSPVNSTSTSTSTTTTPWWTSENTLFGVWMGVNDVGNSYYQSNVTDILDATMVKYFEQLQIVYDAGGRNFVLLSVPRESSRAQPGNLGTLLSFWRGSKKREGGGRNLPDERSMTKSFLPFD